MDKFAVVNASPLIFLSRGHHLELLHNFARHIYVPEPVAAEINVKGSQDITARAVNENTKTPETCSCFKERDQSIIEKKPIDLNED